jgi:hypothetical protein
MLRIVRSIISACRAFILLNLIGADKLTPHGARPAAIRLRASRKKTATFAAYTGNPIGVRQQLTMSVPSEAFAVAQRYLEKQLPLLLTPAVRAVTLEVNSWLVEVRLYHEGLTDDAEYDRMERVVLAVAKILPHRGAGEKPWQVGLGLERQDGPAALQVYGTPIFTAPGTRIATIDLVPVPDPHC